MSLTKSKSVDDLSAIPLFASSLPNDLKGTDFAALVGLIDEEEDERQKRQLQQREARRLAKATTDAMDTSSDRHGPIRGSRKKNKQIYHPYEFRESCPVAANEQTCAQAGPTAGEAILAMSMMGI